MSDFLNPQNKDSEATNQPSRLKSFLESPKMKAFSALCGNMLSFILLLTSGAEWTKFILGAITVFTIILIYQSVIVILRQREQDLTVISLVPNNTKQLEPQPKTNIKSLEIEAQDIPAPNIVFKGVATHFIKFDSPVFRIVENESKLWGFMVTFQNETKPPEKVGSIENVEAQISYYPFNTAKGYIPVLHGCWLNAPTYSAKFSVNQTHSLILGMLEKKNGKLTNDFIIYEYSPEKHKPVKKATLNYNEGMTVEIKLIAGKYGEIKTPHYKVFLVPHGKEFQKIDTKQGQMENPAERHHKITQLKKFIEEGAEYYSGQLIPITPRTESYAPRVRAFLIQYFGESHANRFDEGGIVALEEILKELLNK